MKTETHHYERIETLARRNGVEHSLYLGEAIGNALVIAWNAFGALGGLYRRRASTGPAPTLGSDPT